MINSVRTDISSIKDMGYNNNDEKKLNVQNKKDIQEVTHQNKIAQIKESIDNKDYQIDLRKTSEKMALDLLNL